MPSEQFHGIGHCPAPRLFGGCPGSGRTRRLRQAATLLPHGELYAAGSPQPPLALSDIALPSGFYWVRLCFCSSPSRRRRRSSDDLNAILRRSDELRAAGNYAAALIEAQKLEAGIKARFGVNHGNYAVALNNLALVYEGQGRYTDAEANHKRALAINEKALGADHPDVATTLNNLAVVYNNQGKYAEAEGLYKRALAIYEKALGADHPEWLRPSTT